MLGVPQAEPFLAVQANNNCEATVFEQKSNIHP
jgi:hypothetical protein